MMITNKRKLILGAVLGASISVHATPVLFPNGDFEAPGGDQWGESSGGLQVFNYPATGGSGDNGGYAEMVSSEAGGYAVLISNNDQPLPLGDLGLTAGETYTFTYDMKCSVAGAGKGGIKFESWTATAGISNSGDLRQSPATTDWETYTYDYTIAPGATHIKVVPLWTPNETVGFDNIGVDNTPLVVPPPPLLPNGNFEAAGGSGWPLIAANGSHTASFPATGGNDGGYAEINSVGAPDWAVLVANNNTPISLASLDLTAGETYTFKVDMKIFEGSNLGGIALDFVPGGTGDLRPSAIINGGTTWETYEFEITIPEGTTLIFVKLVWGVDSRVGFDNITFVPPAPLSASIAKGTVVNWSAEPFSLYQAQTSPDDTTWTDLGPILTGDSVTSAFDPDGAAFYRVLEIPEPFIGNAVANPSFEFVDTAEYPNPGATDWAILSPEDTDPADGIASMTVETSYTNDDLTQYNPQEGTRMLVIESSTPAEGPVTPPNTNVRSANFAIVPATEAPYEISFHAINLYKIGGANPQYRFNYFDDSLVFLGDSGFTSFAGVGDSWTKVEATIDPPANAAWMTIEWIQAMGAGNGWRWVTLIDNVNVPYLEDLLDGEPIPATTAPGVEVRWNTRAGRSYQVMRSDTLSGFVNLGTPVTGDGGPGTLIDEATDPAKFYQVEETTP